MARKKTALEKAKEAAKKLRGKKSKSKKPSYVSQGQNPPQSKAYTETADKTVGAKPVGWRWTTDGAARLKKKVSTKPSAADIEKYKNKTFTKGGTEHRYLYSEKRVDKSDYKKAAKFAKGGKSDSGISHYKVNDEIFVDYNDAMAYCDKHNMPYSKITKTKEYAKGGTTGFSGRQNDPYNKGMDGDKTAKPVGYRFTDKLAKRLGVSVTAKPTAEQIDKYIGRGVYWEGRQDKADLKPSKKYLSFEKGGFSGRQNNPYNKGMDGEKTAKPVGYRFTDARAAKLGKSPYARPTGADVEKYSGKGVYWEGRQDKADKKPSKNYLSFARGGSPRIANQNAREYTENMLPFKANNLEGKTLSNGDYAVLSYGWYPLWYYSKAEGKWYGNATKYSQSTSRQASQSRPTYDAAMVSRADLDDIMFKNHAQFAEGGVVDVLGDTANAPMTNIGGTMFSQADLTAGFGV